MLRIVNWQELSLQEKQRCLARPAQAKNIGNTIQTIVSTVRCHGDEALLNYTREFDGVSLSSLVVSQTQIEKATITDNAMNAMIDAIQTLTTYHQAIKPKPIGVKTAEGISIERVYRPIAKVGLYVPGGHHTPLVSSLLMQAIPALIAECPIRILCTPPNAQGGIDPHLLVAARLCQIETIYSIGGAQAIAAMAYGTETIPKVDKIFGPGNGYVTEAKAQVALDPDGAAIDMPAGPSEVMVVADKQANPEFIAADLLAQAEHGVDSQALLICDSVHLAQAVNQAINRQLTQLSRREMIIQSLKQSVIMVCNDRCEQLEIINHYAPEHLMINCEDADSWVKDIQSSGTVFLGQWAAETMGDYMTGSNHVLPTHGFARNYSGLGTGDFMKAISIQSISEAGIRTLGASAHTLALMEGLDAHAYAVKCRLEELT